MYDKIDYFFIFFFQAEDGIRDYKVTGVQTCALPILVSRWALPPGKSMVKRCVMAEKTSFFPSGDSAGSMISRTFTGPCSTVCGKSSLGPNSCETWAVKGISFSFPVARWRRLILPSWL